MVKLKTKRVELNSPPWLVEEWKKGDKRAIAQQLLNVNFDKDTRKHPVTLLDPPGALAARMPSSMKC